MYNVSSAGLMFRSNGLSLDFLFAVLKMEKREKKSASL